MSPSWISIAGVCLLAGASAYAAPLAVDEGSYPGAGGDYNNLLNPPQPEAVVFNLAGGTNTFAGTFGTPGDAGDTFIVQLGPLETLTAIRVIFATNADPFNPVAINQASKLVFDLTSSSEPIPLLSLNLTGRPDGPVQFNSSALSFGEQTYGVTLLTEVLALNSNARVGYRVEFDVTAVPEPATWALLLAGIAGVGALARSRRTA